ncbi:MAG: site-specific DNA-methyltransferase [Ignavibacteriaceae bacterium]|nr:site-specific DNA-methyltransferase [Ignavibacteriaceae bacterium]
MPTLNWIGKEAVEKHHLEIPYRLLEYDDVLSVGDKEDGNLLIQGDNLHALKALLPYYAGKVKCIYIDPPYNTGNEKWSYNDNVNSPEMKKWINEFVGKEGEDLTRHDKWLCMMYPRLQLLKKLLRPDGIIFSSIDDNEVHSLRFLLDEIFGRNNFVSQLGWQKVYSPKNQSKYFSNDYEFVLCYAKNINKCKVNLLPRTEEMNKRYKNPDNDPRGVWKPGDLVANEERTNGHFIVKSPKTGKEFDAPDGKHWSYSETNMQKFLEDNRIWFGKTGNSFPSIKQFLSEVKQGRKASSLLSYKDYGHTDGAKKDIKKVFSETERIPFETPKPIKLIKNLIILGSNENDIILDSFTGTGTTGHAVMELNNEIIGNRKFILVELEEDIAINVTAERLKRVINGYEIKKQNGTIENVEGLGGGFRYCKLGETLFDQFGNVREGVTFKQLAYHIFFSETGVPLKENTKLDTPLIGKYKGVAYYLLFNGILGDKTVNGGNVLTSKVLDSLPKYKGDKIIFGMASRLSTARLNKENIVFKQIPVEIKTS